MLNANINYFDDRLNDEGRRARLYRLDNQVEWQRKTDLERTAIGLKETPVGPTNPGVTSGWEGRSDDSPFKRYIIFEVGGVPEAAAFRSYATNSGLAFKSLQGSWKGRHQPSFICEDTNANRAMLRPWLKGQDAILCIGPAYRLVTEGKEKGLYKLFGNREAVLDWLGPDGYQVTKREPMQGLFQAVSKETALRQDGWTFDPLECQYYAVI